MVFDHCRCLDFDKVPILPSVVFCAERGSSVNMSPLYMVSVTEMVDGDAKDLCVTAPVNVNSENSIVDAKDQQDYQFLVGDNLQVKATYVK